MDDHERTARLSGHPVEPGTEPTAPLHTGPTDEAPPERLPTPAEPAHEAGPPVHGERPERRQLSVTHLVVGLVFLGISALWLAQEVGAVAVEDMDLLVPVLLVVVGAAGLLAGLVRAARRG